MKQDLLKNAGYHFNFDRMLYFNRQTKKAFSIEFVDDNEESELERRIQENGDRNGWRFYFNSDLPDAVRRELEKVLG